MLEAIKSSAFVRSFREKRLFWCYIAVIVATLWCVLIFVQTSEIGKVKDWHIRGLGMVLQIAGALTVVLDLTSTARQYRHGPSWRKTVDYIKSVFFKPVPVAASIGWTEEPDTCSMTVDVSNPFDPHQPTDTRVAQLELFVQDLKRDLNSLNVVMIRQRAELTADLQTCMDELRRESGRVKGQIKQALVGNLNVLTFGVFCLVLGIVLASFPTELAGWSFRLSLGNEGLLQCMAAQLNCLFS